MVLLFGYPESPFAQPKNVFFGHLLTALVGMFFLHFIPLPLFIIIPLAVGFGVALMILFNVTHPPAGGNPIIVIIGSVSIDYLLSPVISGSIIIIIFAIVLNRLILKKKISKLNYSFASHSISVLDIQDFIKIVNYRSINENTMCIIRRS